MRWVKPSALQLDPDLSSLFPIRDEDLAAIAESMRERGYDQAEPIVVWGSHDIVVDGHTRFAAAKQANLDRIYVDERGFEDKRAALEYAIRRQRDRRNLTRAELAAFTVRAMEALDRVSSYGGDRRSESFKASIEALKPTPTTTELWQAEQNRQMWRKSAEETAEKVGVSRAQVERVRAVLSSDDEETKAKLRAGETTVNAAYTAVKQAEQAKQDSVAPTALVLSVQPALAAEPHADIRASYSVADWEALTVEERALVTEFAPLTHEGRRASFNQVNENIDWAKWSWNPVTGCLHNCAYCYARDIAERFYTQRFAPTFLPSRLHAPSHTRVPERAKDEIGWRNVFTCSMADLFGKWVPQDWIDAVFEQVRNSPQWNFLFLTKFPQRLSELSWPQNAWCGTSVDHQYRVDIAEKAFRNVNAGVTWLSCEPMMERLTFHSLEMFDWVVIGAASKSTQTPEFQPPWEWVEHLLNQARAAGCKVYIKPNLKSRPQEYPGLVLP